jgi:EmrB/QacA subfamily drug resistance transporter
MPPSEKPKETNPKILAVIVASAIIMQQIDATAITTALPQMAISLNTDPVRLTIAVTSYLLSIAVFIPVSGWAADRFGGRTVFRAAIALFVLGSIFCGISENVVQLTAARVLQGLGGAMMVPVGRLVLFRSVEKSQLIPVMAYLQVPAQLGPVLGPLLGGFITSYISWRWIFFVNVPLGILGIFLVSRYFDNPREANPRRMDWVGFILTGVSLSCIMYGIEAIGRGAGEAAVAGAVLVIGMIVGALALRHMRRHTHALLDLSVFRNPTFRAGIGAGSVFRAGGGTLVYLLPLLFQVVFGMSAFLSGILTFASAAGAMSMKATARPILKRFGFRNAMVGNALISAVTIAICAFFTDTTPVVFIFFLLLIGGFFQSFQFTATQAIVYADIEHQRMSTASSIASMAQQLSRGFGIAFAAGLLNLSLAWRDGGQLSLIDLQIAFAGATTFVLLSILFCLPLTRDAGAEVSGHRSKIKPRD